MAFLYAPHWRGTVLRLALFLIIGAALALAPQQQVYAALQSCSEAGLDAAIAAGGSHVFACFGPTTITISGTKVIPGGTSVTLDGGGLLTIEYAGIVVFGTVFDVTGNASLTLENLRVTDGGIVNDGTLTVTNGTVSRSRDYGIWNAGTAIITNSTISDSAFVGGIANRGTMTIINSTLSGNETVGISNAGALEITSSTLSGNLVTGIYNDAGGSVTITNSIVANSFGWDCTGSGVYNASNNRATGGCGSVAVTGLDPVLANNGGPTLTHALLPGSNAIDAALNCPPPAADQRGVPRPLGTACDIGAFERGLIVNLPPTARFALDCSDLICTFDASGSTDEDGRIVGYAWDFGDDTTDTGVQVRHIYAADGTYMVTLTVTDDAGLTGSTSQTVTVGCEPPSQGEEPPRGVPDCVPAGFEPPGATPPGRSDEATPEPPGQSENPPGNRGGGG